MSYNCNTCLKKYKSYKSLWNHNKYQHISKKIDTIIHNDITLENSNKKILICNFCNKYLCNLFSLQRHQLKCKLFIDDINKKYLV